MQNFDLAYFQKSADYVRARLGDTPDIGVVLGSALGALAEGLRDRVEIPYADIPNFLQSTVVYHENRLVFGKIGDKKVLFLSGRFHYYEGYTPAELSISVRMLKLLGVKKLILTNAAGAVNTDYRTGDVMVIRDHIKLSSVSPLVGPNLDAFGERFFDVSDLYSADLRKTALACAERSPLTFHEGVYMFFAGPQFETPAEIRMARLLGADAVGMSTVPEALTAAHCGLPVLAFSLITNMAAGIVKDAELSHEEVARTASQVSACFTEYLKDVILNL